MKEAVNKVSETVQSSDGVKDDKISHVNLYQGDKTDNAMNGYAAAYDQNNNETYLNTEGTDISKGGDIITSLFWEAQRKDNTTNGLDLDAGQQLTLASSRGEQAGNLWNRFSETASTTTNHDAVINWNNANAESDTLVKGSEKAKELDTSEDGGVVARSKPLLYTKTFEEYDKKGTVNVITERVDKGDTLVDDFIETDVKRKVALGINTDFDTEKEKFLKNNPQLEYPYKLKEGDRLITDVQTSIEKTTLGKVIEFLPKGDVVVSTTVLAEEDVYGRGGGLTLSGTGEFTVNKDATISGKLNPTVGIGPKTIGSITAGVSYGDGNPFGTVSLSLENVIVEVDFGTQKIGIRGGITTSEASLTYTAGTPTITTGTQVVDKSVNGTGELIKSEQKQFIDSIVKNRLKKGTSGVNED